MEIICDKTKLQAQLEGSSSPVLHKVVNSKKKAKNSTLKPTKRGIYKSYSTEFKEEFILSYLDLGLGKGFGKFVPHEGSWKTTINWKSLS